MKRPNQMTDDELVTEAGNIIEVGGAEIFILAYRSYHKSSNGNSTRICGSLYTDFFNNKRKLPFWVRDFCRKVIRRFNANPKKKSV